MTNKSFLTALMAMSAFAGMSHLISRTCNAQEAGEQLELSREKPTIAPAMLEEMAFTAAKTYEGTNACYEMGTEVLPNVYLWSRRWLEAERALAETDADEIAALNAHRRRMKTLMRKVKALNDTGSKGGEPQKYFATKYYLAEANAWLAAAKHRDEKPAVLNKVSVEFRGPRGLAVRWQEHNESEYRSEPVALPARHEFFEGRVYFVEFSGVGPELEGMLDLTDTTDKNLAIKLTLEDVKKIAGRHHMTQVFFRAGESEVDSSTDWDERAWSLLSDTEQRHEVLAVIDVSRKN